MRKRAIILPIVIIVIGVILTGIGVFNLGRQSQVKAPAPSTQNTQSNSNPASSNENEQTFNKSRYSTTDPNSPWVIANKKHPLPSGFKPKDLVVPNVSLRLSKTEEQMQLNQVAATALEQLFAAAQRDGIALKLSSAYRSEALQKQFYDSYVARDGQAAADTYSARPGTSEHQTGLAADIIPNNDKCHLETCFAETPEGKWLATHAHEHGYVIRYLKGKDTSTGYQYEPWHIRYVGNDLSAELYKSNLTMEEFFDHKD
jgi:D-alanyl-D-alanine carboxypeptidase